MRERIVATAGSVKLLNRKNQGCLRTTGGRKFPGSMEVEVVAFWWGLV
jgi:hypothetical protein